MTCSVFPPPPSDSEFSWGCSTGCFADMQMEEIINVTVLNQTDGGILNCSVVINGVQYFSESFELRVIDGRLLVSVNVFNQCYTSACLHTKSFIQ